jgi:hypothetical protein
VSLEELALIAKLTGQHSSETVEKVMAGGTAANSHLYDFATGDVFNRFWDGGVDEWIRDRF